MGRGNKGMSSVDNRVVNMQFNNKDFASKIADTMVSLQKLDEALKFSEGKQGLSDLGNSVNNVNFSGMESGIDSLKRRFSTLGIVGMTAIQNITNGVIGFAKKLGSKVVSGGISRAMNIEQAKFMIEGLGKSWDKLYKDMDYAVDQTAYGIDSAAKAAAQFSASGIEAGKSMRTALRGISGVAAMTGSSYDDIANIFTKVAGQGRLMGDDLLSMSSRGMNAAADLAKAMNKTETEIRDMVSKGKISFEDFAKVMDEKYGEHAKEANKTFTGSLSNVNAALSRLGQGFVTPLIQTNEMNDKIYNLVDVLNMFRGVINNVKNIITDAGVYTKYEEAVQKASKALTKFLDILSGDTKDENGKVIKSVTDKLESFRKSIGMSQPDFQNLKDTFSGIFSIFKILGHFMESFVKAIFPIGDALKDTGSGFLAITGAVGRYITNLEQAIKESGIFSKVFSGISFVVGNVAKGMTYLAKKFKDLFSDLGGGNKGFLNSFVSLLDALEKKLKPLGGVLRKSFGSIKEIIDGVFSGLGKALKGADFDKIISLLNLGVSGGIGFTFVQFLNNLTTSWQRFLYVISGASAIGKPFDNLVMTLKSGLNELGKSVRGDTIMKLAKSIAILAGSLFLLSIIDPGRLLTALLGLEALLRDMGMIIKQVNDLSGTMRGASNVTFIAASFSIIASGLLIMAAAVKVLSTMSLGEMAKGLGSIFALLIGMDMFMKNASGLKGRTIKKVGKALIPISIGLLILSQAVKQLSQLNLKDLAKGIGGIGVLLVELAIFMNLTKGLKVKGAIGLLGLSAALLIIANVVKQIGKMKPENLAKGLVGLGFVLLELAGFIKLVSGSKGILKASAGMFVLAKAMESLTSSLKVMGNFSEEQLAKGLLSLGGSLVLIAGAMRLMPANMLTASAGLFVAAQAIKEIAVAMASMGGMSQTEMAKSLVEMAGALGILALAMKAMNSSLAGAAALLVVSAALSVLAPVLKMLGSMSIEQIAGSLVALAGAFVIIGVAGAVLSPLAGSIIILSGAIALLGVGLLSIGAGMMLFVSALKLLSESLTAILHAVPVFIDTIVSMAPKVGFAGMVIVVSLLQAIANNIGGFSAAAIDLVVNFVNAIASKLDAVIDAGLNLAIAFINGIANGIDEHGAELQAALGHLVGSLVKFVLEALASIADAFGGAGKWIGDKLRDFEDAADNIFGDGTVSKNVEKEMGKASDSVNKNSKKAKNSAKKEFGEVPKAVSKSAKDSKNAAKKYSSIEDVMKKSMKGTIKAADLSKDKDFIKNAENAGKSYKTKLEKTDTKKSGKKLGSDAANGAGSQEIYNLMENGGVFSGKGYVNGLLSMVSEADKAGYKLAKASKAGQKRATGEGSPAKEFIKGGKFAGEGFVIGMRRMISSVYNTGYALGDSSVTALKESFKRLNANIVDIDSTPTIRPVLDLSNVKMGLNSIDSMFNENQYALRVAGSLASGGVRNTRSMRPMTVNANITVSDVNDGRQFADDFMQELEVYARTNNG